MQNSIIKYIRNPELLNEASVVELENILKEYPYFHSAHVLYLKVLKEFNKESFESQLHYSAAHIYDRTRLHEFLHTEFDKAIVPEQETELILEDIDTETDEPTESVGVEKESIEILDPIKVKRRIKDGLENMGLNISATLESQIEFSDPGDEDKVELTSEIYFKEEEVEKARLSSKKRQQSVEETNERFEMLKQEIDLLEIDENEIIENKNKKPTNTYFDINEYKSEDEFVLSNDLISKFITENPTIKRPQPNGDFSEDIAKVAEKSTKSDQDLYSDKLAQLYIKQGYLDKALEAYEILCLKYPEKNSYFATQIQMVKELISKHKNS